MGEAIFWMAVGGVLVGVVQHFWKNKKFRELIHEEQAKAKTVVGAVKSGLSKL